MGPEALAAYLHRNIPITAAMGVGVVSVSSLSVVLSAPLLPNINHRETVFGGSASALAILSAWALVHLRLEDEGIAHRLVIHRNTMAYEAPIAGDFTAQSSVDEDDWRRFVEALRRRGKARVIASATLEYGSAVAGRLDAEFVALPAA